MALEFRNKPGPRERHLQRKHENRLFGANTSVTPERLAEARRLDDDEAAAFAERMRELFLEAANLPVRAESEVVLEIKERLDQAYEEACRIAGDHTAVKNGIRKLATSIMAAVRVGAARDSLAQAKLEQEDAARAAHFALVDVPLIADLLDPESSIAPDELVPTLLSESVEAVQAATRVFDAEQLSVICEEGRGLLARIDAEAVLLPEAHSRLRIIENALLGTDSPCLH